MDKFDILVNKENKLPFYYVPNNLVDIPSTHNFIRIEKLKLNVYKDFLKLQEFSRKKGLNIYISSGYRSFEKQLRVYMYYLKTIGIESTKKRVAIPGTSEHQTGLAFDLSVIENNMDKNITIEESKWLEENAHQYGFILRYPMGKEDITGFNFEPWHFRYVGDIANYMYENNLTLEEYHVKRK